MNTTSKVAGRQAEICLTLVREIDHCVLDLRQPADQVLARIYRQHREYGARDRRFFSNAVFSWFRWRGWLKTTEKEKIAAAILLDASEIPPQLEYLLADTDPARTGLRPLGPLPLDDKAEALKRFLKLDFPALDQLVPPWFADFLFIPEGLEPSQYLRQCISSFQTRPPTWLRLRSDRREQLIRSLAQKGLEIKFHPLMKEAAFAESSQGCDLSRLPGVEVQDLASQCVGIVCAPKPGEKWWDVCAGSGGKSLHLADLMRDTGRILATDIRPAILERLSGRLKRNQYRSIKISLWDGAVDLPARLHRWTKSCGQVQALQAGPTPAVCFDGVLIDAPCSGLGTWARNPDARWRIASAQIQDYARTQNNLLQIGAGKVRAGGRLVYATCTLTKTENIEVISRFLEHHPEFRLVNTINPLSCNCTDGLIWIRPWEWNSNGLFMAVMKRHL